MAATATRSSGDSPAGSRALDAAPESHGERKFAVALFADLSGFTALCTRLDPEEVERAVRPLMTSLMSAAESHGGVIVNVAGDGFFALYGVPLAMADAGDRAANGAAEMCRIIATHRDDPWSGETLDIHIGIAAGEILITPRSEPLGWSVIGSPINLASRLCDAAAPGEVLVSRQARDALTGSGAWGQARSLTLKGFDGDVEAWPLVSGATAIVPRPEVRFVGRQQELRALDAELEEATTSGRGRVVVVSGPPGIGKTRLLRHWLARVDRKSVWLEPPVEAAPGLMRLVDLLNAQLPARSGEAGPLDFLRTDHAHATRHRDDPMPFIAAAARKSFEQISAEGPFVLVIEDLLATDVALVELLTQLSDEPVQGPVLVVCLVRDDEDPPLPAGLRLPALREDETTDLIENALGARLPEAAARTIANRAAGNPLMAVETIRYLNETAAVVVADGTAVVARPADLEALPSSLRLSISARIDHLPPTEKLVLLQASCFHAEWPTSWPAQVLGQAAAGHIPSLANRGFLQEGPAGRWRFTHGLVHQVAYAATTHRDRAGLHRRQLSLLPRPAPPDVRAFHAISWAESASRAEPENARAAALEALACTRDLAVELFQTDASAAHVAIRRIRPLVEDHGDAVAALASELLCLDARCLIELGRFDDSLQTARNAEHLASSVDGGEGLRAQVLLVRGHALSRLRRFESARQVLDEAEALAKRTGDLTSQGHAIRLMADTWRHSLFSRYVTLTEEAYDLLATAGDRAGAGDCSRILAYLFSPSAPGLYDRWRKIADAATEDDDIRGQAWLARSGAFAMAARFDFDSCAAEAERARRLGEQCGAKDVVFDALSCLVTALAAKGQLQLALDALSELTSLAEVQSNVRMTAVLATLSAHVAFRAGKTARSAEDLQFARSQLDGFGPSEQGPLLLTEGWIQRDRGLWHESAASLSLATELAEGAGFRLYAFAARAEAHRAGIEVDVATAARDLGALSLDADEPSAPLFASYVAALVDLADAVLGGSRPKSIARPGACLEELAIRADTAALRTELRGEESRAAWEDALKLWRQLGYTVWLARAQARSGDLEAAHHTLDVLDSPSEARMWALGEPQRPS